MSDRVHHSLPHHRTRAGRDTGVGAAAPSPGVHRRGDRAELESPSGQMITSDTGSADNSPVSGVVAHPGRPPRSHHLQPASIAKPPRIPDEEIIPFTKEEAGKLLQAAKDMRNGARFVIALTLGLRKGEALGLQWRDVDLDNQTLTIRRSVQRLNWRHGCPPGHPCGRRYAGHCPNKHSGGVVAAEVKSRAGKRTVGIPTPLVDVLTRHSARQERDRALAANLWVEQGWVFTNRLGGPVHPRVDHNEWKALLKKAGVRDARLHDARHTAATMLLLLGVPSRAVMDVMGWSQASMWP